MAWGEIIMPVDLVKFTQFYDHLFKIDFTGNLPGMRPRLSTEADVLRATGRGAPFLPRVYHQNFYQPMMGQLPNLMNKLRQQVQSGQKTPAELTARLESLYAVVYQHGTKVTRIDARAQLTRFLAVVSNLYRSFVNANKRSAVGVTLVTETPPLAFFQSDSMQGPYTIESDLMHQFFGMSIGIVSLPASYRDHPVIWASLTHEVCGHDVVHADEGLVPEMVAAVRAKLAPDFKPRKKLDTATLNALIWSYWIDEAAADVYGVLNMGPSFPLNLAAMLAAFRGRIAVDLKHEPRPAKPRVATRADPRDHAHGDEIMDDHPIDLLRFYLAAGVIETMTKLNASARAGYVADVEAVAKALAGGATEISVAGLVQISHDDWMPIKETMKLSDAATAARQVGRIIATGKFKALNNHSIQDIETWDDADEEIAQSIAGQILRNESVIGRGDDAQLLAGVTLAVLQRPDLYDAAGALLNAALDDSYLRDPIWGELTPDHAFAPNAFAGAPSGRKPTTRKSGGKKSKRGGNRRSRS
jgi:hypothetical protein